MNDQWTFEVGEVGQLCQVGNIFLVANLANDQGPMTKWPMGELVHLGRYNLVNLAKGIFVLIPFYFRSSFQNVL